MCSVSIASHQQHDIRRAPEHSSLSISYLPTRCAFTHYMRRTAVALGILEAASTGSSAARECCYDLARKLTEPLSCDRPLRDRPAHDERLWTGITKANGALGNTSCLVGTAEQVAELAACVSSSVSSFLMRGFDPVSDTVESGRELIPRRKSGRLRSIISSLLTPADAAR